MRSCKFSKGDFSANLQSQNFPARTSDHKTYISPISPLNRGQEGVRVPGPPPLPGVHTPWSPSPRRWWRRADIVLFDEGGGLGDGDLNKDSPPNPNYNHKEGSSYDLGNKFLSFQGGKNIQKKQSYAGHKFPRVHFTAARSWAGISILWTSSSFGESFSSSTRTATNRACLNRSENPPPPPQQSPWEGDVQS